MPIKFRNTDLALKRFSQHHWSEPVRGNLANIFSLKVDFHFCVILTCVRTYVNFYRRVDEIEAIYGRSRVNAIVEPRSTFTFTRG